MTNNNINNNKNNFRLSISWNGLDAQYANLITDNYPMQNYK